jgi:hypothetical protein
MAYFKVRIGSGTPPYIGTVRNLSNTTILHSISQTSNDEIEIPDSVMDNAVGGVRVEISDYDEREGVIEYDSGTLRSMKRYLAGFSVANGDPNDHVQKIVEGEQRNFSFTGVIIEGNDFVDDAYMIAFENAGVFNHVPALPNPPVYGFDKTVKAMMQNNFCNMIRVNVWLKRAYGKLNNGSTRTFFVGESDAQMRPDGSPILKPQGGELGQFFDMIIPSFAAENTFTYASRLMVAIIKRYITYINAGNIIAIGTIFVSSGEAEVGSIYTIGEGNIDTFLGQPNTHGDFNPASISKFKSRFPQYNSLNNYDIASAAYGSNLSRDWNWHNNQMIIEFEHRLADHIIANVPGLTRKKFLQIDSGSFVDGQANERRTLNSTQRAIHPASFLFKSNDNSNVSTDDIDFVLDHISSLARRTGGIAIVEPSPPNYESGENTGYLVAEIQRAAARGVGISYYTPNGGVASNLTTLSGITPGSIPSNKNEFKTVNGNKRLVPHKINISDVLINGANGGNKAWTNSWKAFRLAQGLSAVDTQSIDNVNPQ